MKLLIFLADLIFQAVSLRRPGVRGFGGVIPSHAINNHACAGTEVQFLEHEIYRSIDGVCNNLESPYLGAANSVLGRFLEPEYQDCRETPRGGFKDGDLYENRIKRESQRQAQLNIDIREVQNRMFGCPYSRASSQQLPNVREVSQTFHPDAKR